MAFDGHHPLETETGCAYEVRMNIMRSQGTTSRGGTRPTNVSLNAALVDEAKALGVNISLAAASGLERAVAYKRAERWIEENSDALGCYNDYVERNGLPLETLRLF